MTTTEAAKAKIVKTAQARAARNAKKLAEFKAKYPEMYRYWSQSAGASVERAYETGNFTVIVAEE